MQKFLNDQMSQKNLTSEDYFNMLADNAAKFVTKKTEEDIDLIRRFFGFRKPEPPENLSPVA